MKRIKFLITPQGATTILDAEGFGSGCVAATSGLERRLGVVDEASRQSTPSAYQEPQQQVAEQGAG